MMPYDIIGPMAIIISSCSGLLPVWLQSDALMDAYLMSVGLLGTNFNDILI